MLAIFLPADNFKELIVRFFSLLLLFLQPVHSFVFKIPVKTPGNTKGYEQDQYHKRTGICCTCKYRFNS